MNHEIARKWTAALRSGKYPQGRGHLGDKETGLCCIGVLCLIAMQEGIIDSYESRQGGAPKEVQDWAGFSFGKKVGNEHLTAGECPFLYKTRQLKYLSVINDYGLSGDGISGQASFSEIADIIDENVDQL